MTIKRRTFLKGTAGVAGGGALASLLSGGTKTLVEGAKSALQTHALFYIVC